MKQPSAANSAGLRERKKAKTRAAIQEHALRLFGAQGYAATSVEQIAAAAEVSPSTFFRYFPTKEDVVLYDALDPLLLASFRAQPPALTPIQAMRAGFRATFAALSPADLAQQQKRAALVMREPALRMRMLDEILNSLEMLGGLIGERVGRPGDDFAVRVFAGAVVGAVLAAWLPAFERPGADLLAAIDAALAELEAGLLL